MSDPNGWIRSNLNGGDPEVIPGAFFSDQMDFQAIPGPASIHFVASNGEQRTYELLPGGLRFTIADAAPTMLQVPLLLDPWQRFQPNWAGLYHSNRIEAAPGGYSWEIRGEVGVEVRATAPITLEDFTGLLPYLDRPENPDQDYPGGNFLPFPMALAEIRSPGSLVMTIQAAPAPPNGP